MHLIRCSLSFHGVLCALDEAGEFDEGQGNLFGKWFVPVRFSFQLVPCLVWLVVLSCHVMNTHAGSVLIVNYPSFSKDMAIGNGWIFTFYNSLPTFFILLLCRLGKQNTLFAFSSRFIVIRKDWFYKKPELQTCMMTKSHTQINNRIIPIE